MTPLRVDQEDKRGRGGEGHLGEWDQFDTHVHAKKASKMLRRVRFDRRIYRVVILLIKFEPSTLDH